MTELFLDASVRRLNRRIGKLSAAYRLREGWRFERLSSELWLVSKGQVAVIAELTKSAAEFVDQYLAS